jgi:hypothetical protein
MTEDKPAAQLSRHGIHHPAQQVNRDSARVLVEVVPVRRDQISLKLQSAPIIPLGHPV